MKEKIGIVRTIYPNKCTARVQFEDCDNVLSNELQIVVKGSFKNKDYWMPKVGEQVLCLFTEQKRGYILGSVYSEENPVPAAEENIRCIQFEDGSVISYDSKTHTLFITSKQTISVKVSGDVIAGGISLKSHTHSGVHGETSAPIGGI